MEDVARIWLEFWVTKYNMPRPIILKDNDMEFTTTMTGTQYREFPYSVRIDVGASSQYSEIAQQESLRRLFEAGAIDVVMYVKYSSENSIPHKETLLKELEMNKQTALQQMGGMGMETPQGSPSMPPQGQSDGAIAPTQDGANLGVNSVYPPSLNYVKDANDVDTVLPGIKR